jgi:hypothetical protein
VLSAAVGLAFSSAGLLGQPSTKINATIAQAAISFFTVSSFLDLFFLR